MILYYFRKLLYLYVSMIINFLQMKMNFRIMLPLHGLIHLIKIVF
nr:MAG TPA_asm: hypothetical protein [Bacteriophage sp.]